MSNTATAIAPLPRSTAELAAQDARQTPDTRLDAAAITALSPLLSGWRVEGLRLEREFRFPDFHATMAFVNALAWIAHRADHHPDMTVGYNRCHVQWSTHSAGGLTLKDLICAAQVDALQCPRV